MAKGDIIEVTLSGVAAADDGMTAIEFNDGNLVIGMKWQQIMPFLMAVAEAGAQARALQMQTTNISEIAYQASKMGVRTSPDGNEVRMQFEIFGGFQMNVLVPVSGLPQIVEGLQVILAKHKPDASGMN